VYEYEFFANWFYYDEACDFQEKLGCRYTEYASSLVVPGE